MRSTKASAVLFLIIAVLLAIACSQQKVTTMDHPPLTTYKLAMAQMMVEAGKPDANLDSATARIAEAANKGAQIVLLPEAMDLGWTDPSAKTMAYEIPDGKTCRQLRDAAAKNNIYVCAGIIEKDGDKTYNAAVIIDPTG